eukprot:1157705-Pelagomonas_calceolata.AAC.8
MSTGELRAFLAAYAPYVLEAYNLSMGASKPGPCAGVLAHAGHCTKYELHTPVTKRKQSNINQSQTPDKMGGRTPACLRFQEQTSNKIKNQATGSATHQPA